MHEERTDKRAQDAEATERQPARSRRRRGPGRVWRFVLRWVLLIALAAGVLLFVWSRIESIWPFSKRTEPLFPGSIGGLLPDGENGYNRVDFTDAILGETRDKTDLVVMEKDVLVETQISQTLANIALFSKTKHIRSYGTGVFAVELAGLGAEQIEVNTARKLVTVTIPHARLLYVNISVEKTEFEDTQRGLLAFSEIRMTAEQQKLLEEAIDSAMRDKLDDETLLAQADEKARTNVRELLQPLVSAVANDYVVKVVMP